MKKARLPRRQRRQLDELLTRWGIWARERLNQDQRLKPPEAPNDVHQVDEAVIWLHAWARGQIIARYVNGKSERQVCKATGVPKKLYRMQFETALVLIWLKLEKQAGIGRLVA